MRAQRAWSKLVSTTCGSRNSNASFLARAARAYRGPRCYPRLMKRHHYLVPLLLSVALAACGSASDPATRAVELNQDFQLAPAEQAALGPQRLSVEFLRVVE